MTKDPAIIPSVREALIASAEREATSLSERARDAAELLQAMADHLKQTRPKDTNVFLFPNCVHVSDGAQPIDVVRVVTVGQPPPLTYRFQKGPDEMAVCAECALEVFALLMKQCGRGHLVKPLPDDD